jgi:hypothetical protein
MRRNPSPVVATFSSKPRVFDPKQVAPIQQQLDENRPLAASLQVTFK